ncbi:unnamed protein product [Linum tenue]|uniref:Bifunctional inhibitor/plant lipid transfer protein/seed storage helical domain-containing protein n=1 Tax=Linum tenue TaxID=586396 RepID=A0AAV0MUE6_9ROSI|nr:unnamed protein product [Linum tenue]
MTKTGVVLGAALLLLAITTPGADARTCGVDVQGVAEECTDYVKKGSKQRDPSPQCCTAIGGADIGCACKKLLTPDVQSLLDMNNVVYVGRKCGISIPKGTKCGISSSIIEGLRP